MHCRKLAAELGLTSVQAYKMDATTAVQSCSRKEVAASESGDLLGMPVDHLGIAFWYGILLDLL